MFGGSNIVDLCVEIEGYWGLLLCHLGDVLILLFNQHYYFLP